MKYGIQKQYKKRLGLILELFIAETQEDIYMEIPASKVARWFVVKPRDIRNLSIIAQCLSPLRIITEMIEKMEESGEEQSPYVSGATLATVEAFGNMFIQMVALTDQETALKRIYKVVGATDAELKNVLKALFEEYEKRFILRLNTIMHEFSYPFDLYDAVLFKGCVTEEQFKGMVYRYGIK